MLKWIETLLTRARAAVAEPVSSARRAEDFKKLGNKFLADGDFGKAEECYRQSIAASPGFADAYIALGFVLLKQERLSDAKHCLKQAASLDPDEADSHYLLGAISQKQNEPGEAIENFSRALEVNPRFVEAHHGLGVVFRIQGRLDEAMRCFDEALSLRPDFAESRFNKSLILLMRGDFVEGLELFESRVGLDTTEQLADWSAFLSGHPEMRRWRGDALEGKRLLIWTEEGLGDCLMAMRYLPKLAERGAGRILVLSDPSLARLLKTFPMVNEVTSRADLLSSGSFDVHCPIMSLPYAFATRSDTIPNAVPYLSVPHEMRRKWSETLSGLNGPRVGLVWRGGKKYGRDFLRSLSLQRLGPLTEIAGVSFVSLQKGEAAGELAGSDRPILDRMGECGDFLDTAALVANLDLVISVDTSVAHLAGALGKPVWLLNRFESEWRWQLGREDSPWYPTMRIFRQPALDDWDSVVKRVAGELARFARSGAA
ncbi:MAG TPA: tetratricopeptide repeat protein [Burkholderiales bacterium]|nr:tetratricopeptide repeat protein [Burkholderiales bacterium]